ncbi:MAG: ribosome biogenesis GTPase Der [Deltaproteobacteria bacterium]|nr:ribosome biogenesis GTPase Der [Deltaproteobacteria bacterium]
MPSALLPIVAIVGRPNVGKSTLFNRLAGRRRALVDDHPGLTRDRIVEEVEAGDRRVLLVDTAGLEPLTDRDGEGEDLHAAVQAQARAAVAEADAVLFVVDGQAGLLPGDEAIARELRRTSRPLVLVVNKLDAPRHDAALGEFHRLGFASVRAVSAEHGRGAWDAFEDLVGALPVSPGEGKEEASGALGDAEPVRIALVGRPNVGKSSLANRLLGRERMVVSNVAGTTRDAIDLEIERADGRYVLVDTAGLRRPGRRDRVGEKPSALMALRAIERAEVALVVTDASQGFTEGDVQLAGLVRQRGCAAAILVNKWDLAGDDAEATRRAREAIRERLRFAPDVPVLTVSARTGLRLPRIFPLARRLARATRLRIPTPELNRWLQDAVAAHEPAMAQRGPRKRPLRFFYATQVAQRPPTFVLFCTEPAAVKESYRRFLENRLRERFDLEGAPVRLQLRARRSKEG